MRRGHGVGIAGKAIDYYLLVITYCLLADVDGREIPNWSFIPQA